MVYRNDQEDLALIERAKEGDAEAFGKIYERYAGAIYRYFYARLNDAQDAEDLLGDVFLSTWRSLAEYRPVKEVPFRVFLFRIARNRLVDFYRKQSHRYNDVIIDEDIHEISDETTTTEDQEKIAKVEMQDLMTELREDYRTVIELRFYGGLSPSETAQVMGKSEGAIRVLQHRALKAFHKLFVKVER